MPERAPMGTSSPDPESIDAAGAALRLTRASPDSTTCQSGAWGNALHMFDAVLAHVSDMLVVLHADGGIAYGSPSLARVLGYDRAALPGRQVLDGIHPDDRSHVQTTLTHLCNAPQASATLEVRVRHASGRWHTLDVTACSQLHNAQIVGLIVTARDVTERKRAEAALRHQHAYFAALHDTTLSIIRRQDLTDVLHDIVLRAGAVVGTPHGYLFLVDGATERLVLQVGSGAFGACIGRQLARGCGVAGRVWESSRPLAITRYHAWDGRLDDCDTTAIEAVAAVPLISGATVVGVLGLAHGEPGASFGDAEMMALERFAQLATITLDHVQIHATRQRDMIERIRLQQQSAAFAALGQQLSSVGLVEAAYVIADTADQLLTWDAFILNLYDAERDQVESILRLDVINGVRLEVPPTRRVFTPSAVARRTLTDGAQLVFADGQPSTQESRIPFGDTQRRSASLMYVPIKTGAQTIGLLSIQSYTSRAYTPTDLATLQALADHCGGALERIRTEKALQQREAQLRAIFDGAAIGIALAQTNGTIVASNPALRTMLGYDQAELHGLTIGDITHREDMDYNLELINTARPATRDTYRIEKRYIRKDGTIFWGRLTASLIQPDPHDPPLLVGMVEDITARKRAEATIHNMAYYDSLTQLPNRLLFHDRLRQALALARRHKRQTALLFLDLDRFKIINDTLGHHTGDRLLQAVAQRLIGSVRAGDTVARMGGDEFTVILPNVNSSIEVAEIAQRLITSLTTGFVIDGRELFASTSIGISLYPDDGSTVESLLKQADAAMYRAKERSRNSYAFYTPTMDAAAFQQLELEQRLRRALERDEFVVHYQPRINTLTGQIVAVEALVRWQHPEGGLIGPAAFIAVAEDTGLIVPIGEWVLRTACTHARQWRAAGAPPLRVAVNLSARQFQQPDLTERIAAIIHETGFDPTAVELEITESMMMVNAERTIVVLRALKAMGLHLAIDDFGTGYSSLSYLKQFPIDTLKIDRSFIRDLNRNASDAAIVQAVITLGHNLALSVAAEGVETEAQHAFLRQHHCDEIQGFLINHPMPAATMRAHLLASIAAPADVGNSQLLHGPGYDSYA